MSACLSPIRVYNQQKFLVTGNSDSLFNVVRCGQCASCQQNKAAEWSFRAFKHYESCVNKGGYVLFDTLTYSDCFVPRLKDLEDFADLPVSLNYMCFRREDVRGFLARIRSRLRRRGYAKDCFDMFITSEYGTDERFTHRPHYHCLFYVFADIDPLFFSHLISECWYFGRTDGGKWKDSSYILSNVFRSLSVGGRKVSLYVSKYVQKHSSFEKQINRRIFWVVNKKFGYDKSLIDSDEGRRFIRDLRRRVCQFHRQSHGFGLSAIQNIDIDKLFDLGYFLLPNGEPSMFTKIPITTYYLRKLCYEKVTLDDGYSLWSVRPDRRYLLEKRRDALNRRFKEQLSLRFKNACLSPVNSIDEVGDYMLNRRFRFRSCFNEILTIGERLDMADIFMYSSSSDKSFFGRRVWSDRYVGYCRHYFGLSDAVLNTLDCLVSQVQYDSSFENDISLLESVEMKINSDVQKRYEIVERATDVARSVY